MEVPPGKLYPTWFPFYSQHFHLLHFDTESKIAILLAFLLSAQFSNWKLKKKISNFFSSCGLNHLRYNHSVYLMIPVVHRLNDAHLLITLSTLSINVSSQSPVTLVPANLRAELKMRAAASGLVQCVLCCAVLRVKGERGRTYAAIPGRLSCQPSRQTRGREEEEGVRSRE